MRRVVVFPQPEGPRSVANEPRGTSKDTSSTAAVSPKRFVTRSSRRWMSGTGASKCDAASREERDRAERDDREADVRHRERRGASPVQIADELEDADRRDGAARREQEDDDGQRRHGTDERRHEADAQRSAEHRHEDVTEAAQAGGAEARGGLVQRAVDLTQARHRGLIAHRDVPEDHRDDDEHTAVEPVEPRLVEREGVADPEEETRYRGGHDEEQVERAAAGPASALHEPPRHEREQRGEQ